MDKSCWIVCLTLTFTFTGSICLARAWRRSSLYMDLDADMGVYRVMTWYGNMHKLLARDAACSHRCADAREKKILSLAPHHHSLHLWLLLLDRSVVRSNALLLVLLLRFYISLDGCDRNASADERGVKRQSLFQCRNRLGWWCRSRRQALDLLLGWLLACFVRLCPRRSLDLWCTVLLLGVDY